MRTRAINRLRHRSVAEPDDPASDPAGDVAIDPAIDPAGDVAGEVAIDPAGDEAGDEAGAVTVFVVLVIIALVAAAGLVIDGGYTLAAKREAIRYAEQASRRGSDALDQGSLRDGDPRVSPTLALRAAQAYLHQVGADGTVTVDGARVSVEVTKQQPMAILSAIGIGHLTVHGTASSTSIDEDTRE